MTDNPIIPLTPQQTAAQEIKAAHEPYPERVLVAIDKTVETAAGGVPDVTISEQAGIDAEDYKGARGFYGRWMSRFLDIFQHDHGAKATAGGDAQAEEALKYGEQSGLVNKK